MNKYIFVVTALAACLVAEPACHRAQTSVSNPIVGAWFVKAPGAPFEYHMFLFSADGTMQQANPDAGDANTSDSDGMGVWLTDGDRRAIFARAAVLVAWICHPKRCH
jgi:hypothetical protein